MAAERGEVKRGWNGRQWWDGAGGEQQPPVQLEEEEQRWRDKGQMDSHILHWVTVERAVQHCNYKFGWRSEPEKGEEERQKRRVVFVMAVNEEPSLIEW